jgi:hypothetical protein
MISFDLSWMVLNIGMVENSLILLNDLVYFLDVFVSLSEDY